MTKRFLCCLTALLFWMPLPAWTYGDPPQTFTSRGDSGTEFAIEVIPVDCFLTPQAYQSLQDGAFFMYHFLRRFEVEFPARLVFKIRIFASNKDYKDYQQKNSEGDFDWGYYSPRDNEIVIPLYPTESETVRVIFHEMTHAFLRQSIQYLPRWFNEGLAMYFEMMSSDETGLTVQPQIGFDWMVKMMLVDKSLMELRAYLEISAQWEEFNKATVSPPYAVAWSVTYFLMSSEEGQSVIKHLLAHFKKSAGPNQSSTETINLYYSSGLDGLETDWHAWIPQSRMPQQHERQSF